VFLIFWARPFLKYKIVYAVHEDPYSRKDSNNPAVMGSLERIFIARADVVATYSDYMKGVLAAHIPQQKIKTILLGAYDAFCPNFIHKGFHETGPLRLFFFGPIREYKGVDTLVVAMAICKKKGLDATLAIAGQQDPGVKIIDEVEVAELGIKWTNRFLSREEVGAVLAESDVMVIPYKEATQTTPGAIALAYGIPAIGTRTGGLPEQVEDGVNGLIVEAGNPEALASAIEKICNDRSLLKKFSEGAKMLYATKFNWSVIAKKAIGEIYGFSKSLE
jgi:glycosyltransferase involved in cell wall biosynthesis